MATLQERLNMKRAPLDTWSIREKLFLALTVSRTGDQNWMSVSRSLKPFQENTRPADWFSQRNCAQQYGLLLENIETPKRKKRHSTSSSASTPQPTSTSPNSMLNMDSSTANDTPGEHIIRKLTWERVDELQKSILDKKADYNHLRSEIQLLESGQISEEQLRAMYHEIQEEERQKEIQANEYVYWLNDRENRKLELERAWRPIIRTSSFNALKRKCPDFDKSDYHHETIQISAATAAATTATVAAATAATTPTTVYTPTVVVVKDRESAHLKPAPVSSVQKPASTPSSTVSSSPLLSSLLKSPTSTANFHSNLFSTLLEKDSPEQQFGSSNKNKQSQSPGSSSRTHTPVMDSQPATKVVTITTSALRNAIFTKSPILISTVAPSASNSETHVSATKPIVLSTLESQSQPIAVLSGFETTSKSMQSATKPLSTIQLTAEPATPAPVPAPAAPETTSTFRSRSPSLSAPSVAVSVTPASSIAVPSVAVTTVESSQTTMQSIASKESPLPPPLSSSSSPLPPSPPSTHTNTTSSQNVSNSTSLVTAISQKPIPVLLSGLSNILGSQTNKDVTLEVITVQPSEVDKLNLLDNEFTVSCKSKHEEEDSISKHGTDQTKNIKEEIVDVSELEANRNSSTIIEGTNDEKFDAKNPPNVASDQTVVSDAGGEMSFENQVDNMIESAEEKCTPEPTENDENSSYQQTTIIDITDKNVSIKDEIKEKAIESNEVTKPIEKDAISEMEVSLESETETKEEVPENANVAKAEAEAKAAVTAVVAEKEEISKSEPVDTAADMAMEVEVETVTVTPMSIATKIEATSITETVTTTKVTEQTEIAEETAKSERKSDSVEEPHSLVRRTRMKRDYTRNTKLNRKADFDYEMNFNSDEFDDDSNNESIVMSSSTASLRKKEPTETAKHGADEKKVTVAKHPSDCASPWTDDEAFVVAASTVVAATAVVKQPAQKRVSNKRRISIDTESNSPSPVLSLDDERDSRTTRKSFLLLYNRLVSHKYANHFMKPITDDLAPEYNEIIKQPMDFSTIKRNIDNCCTKTVADFKRDVLLMFNNAFMYNESDSDVFLEAAQMQKDCIQMFEQFVESQNQTHISKRETRKSSKSAYKAKK